VEPENIYNVTFVLGYSTVTTTVEAAEYDEDKIAEKAATWVQETDELNVRHAQEIMIEEVF
jgi:hypothetical protein